MTTADRWQRPEVSLLSSNDALIVSWRDVMVFDNISSGSEATVKMK